MIPTLGDQLRSGWLSSESKSGSLCVGTFVLHLVDGGDAPRHAVSSQPSLSKPFQPHAIMIIRQKGTFVQITLAVRSLEALAEVLVYQSAE